MKSKSHFNISGILALCLSFFILTVSGCSGPEYVIDRMDAAESVMETRPDSALAILDSIGSSELKGKDVRARYALLKSMALDKNLVDKTTFEVLQPAIDYYLGNGTPDERLRTYYYEGRIYQNRNDRDSALYSFMRGLDIAPECGDSLTIARSLMAQSIIYQSFYDYDSYIENNLNAADIYRRQHYKWHEFDCLLNALNGNVILRRKEKADSIMKLLDEFDSLDKDQARWLKSQRLTYVFRFGSKQDLKSIIDCYKDSLYYDPNCILNLARAYGKLGDNATAIQYLARLDESGVGYDTLKYLSVKHPILEGLGRYEEALDTYKDFSRRLEAVNSVKFDQKGRSMEERHQLELQAERDSRKHTETIWQLAGGLMVLGLVLAIMLLIIRNQRMRKHLAEQEAENLAHRVEELESESESLKELLESRKEMPGEVREALQTRIGMLNSYLASRISDHSEFEKAYDTWVADLTADSQHFMDSNRLAFQASHPEFIRYFEVHGLTESEINYVCLYAIGLRGKDVGNYMKMRSHANISSAIRKKLGIDRHDTNIGIYVRKLLKEL